MDRIKPRTLSGSMELLLPQESSAFPGTPIIHSNRPK